MKTNVVTLKVAFSSFQAISKATLVTSFIVGVCQGQKSGTKKEHKLKLLSPDIFQWGKGLPHKGVGAEKFGMSLETREIKLFQWDITGFCWDIPAVSEKFEKLCSIFGP